jgi:hypothetical protein
MTPRARPSLLLLAALCALAAGCAGRDATEKELAELHAELARLRAGQAALGERLDKLEIDRGTFNGGAAPRARTAAPGTPDGDRPSLDVVRLSPSEGDGDADPDASRPVLRAVGDGGSVQPGAKKSFVKKGAAPASTPKKPADTDPSTSPKP